MQKLHWSDWTFLGRVQSFASGLEPLCRNRYIVTRPVFRCLSLVREHEIIVFPGVESDRLPPPGQLELLCNRGYSRVIIDCEAQEIIRLVVSVCPSVRPSIGQHSHASTVRVRPLTELPYGPPSCIVHHQSISCRECYIKANLIVVWLFVNVLLSFLY